MNTRRSSITVIRRTNPRLIVGKSIDLSDEEDKFWGVPMARVDYIAIVDDKSLTYLVDDRYKPYRERSFYYKKRQ